VYKAASIDPTYLSPRIGIACVRLMRRDYRADSAKVLEAIDDARRLDPREPWLDFATGLVNQEVRRHDDAARAYQKALAAKDLPPLVRAFTEYRRGLAYRDLDKPSDGARALTTATRIWEDLEKSGADGGDWPRCPMRAVDIDASPPVRSQGRDSEPAWVTKAYKELGYLERVRNNRRAALAAWDKYLERAPRNDPEAEEVRRLELTLRAH